MVSCTVTGSSLYSSYINLIRLDRFDSMKNESLVSSIRIKNPIIQHVSGVSGAFRLQNVEKQRTYTLAEWHSLCERSEHQPPALAARRSSKASPEISNNKLTDYDDSLFTTERCSELEKAYWKTITYNSPLYGADMLGSLLQTILKIGMLLILTTFSTHFLKIFRV